MSGDVPSASHLSVRRGRAPCPEAEQCVKGGHRWPPTIVAKDALVKIDLPLRFTDAVVRPDQPLLHVADGAVGQRHDGGRAGAQGTPDRLRTPNVFHTGGLQVLEPFQAVGMDRRSRADVCLDERDHRRLFEMVDHRHPDATGDAVAVFHGDHDDGRCSALQLPTASQAGRPVARRPRYRPSPRRRAAGRGSR